MDEFNSRRDNSAQGLKKRIEFNQLLIILQNQNMPVEMARFKAIKVFNGVQSEALDYLLMPRKK